MVSILIDDDELSGRHGSNNLLLMFWDGVEWDETSTAAASSMGIIGIT